MIFVNVVTVVINIEIHFLAHVLKIGITLKSLYNVICLQITMHCKICTANEWQK